MVRDATGDQPWVLVARNGSARRQPVRLGLHAGEGVVEVIDGLSAGDLVVPPTAAVKPGSRVKLAFHEPGRRQAGAGPTAAPDQGTSTTGTSARCNTRVATEPSTMLPIAVRPCVPIQMQSNLCSFASDTMVSAMGPMRVFA